MQSSVLCGVRVNMMERRPLVAIGRKATDRIRDSMFLSSGLSRGSPSQSSLQTPKTEKTCLNRTMSGDRCLHVTRFTSR